MFPPLKTSFLCLALILEAFLGGANAEPLLINAQQADLRSRPEYVRDHFAHIESLPFDGMSFTTESGTALMDGSLRTYEQISSEFAAIDGLKFTRMKLNFAHVNVDRPADFFGDWSAVIENFRMLARVLKEKRIAGIFFDNEEYNRLLFNYPDDCDDLSKTIEQYQDQARLRGRQIGQAISAEFPEIMFVALHGPYSSFSGTPDEVRGGQTSSDADEMRGPFSAGIIEGLDTRARFVDGGEVYVYRTTEEFQLSYDYRKQGLARDEENCPYISKYLRPVWAAKVGISFGLYNGEFGGQGMTPSIMRTTLERALRRCDNFVWLYTEDQNWNAPGEFGMEWLDAVIAAKAAAQNPPAGAAPWVSISSPGMGCRFNAPATIAIKASASDADGTVAKVEFFSGTAKLGEKLQAPFTYTWVNPPAGTYSLSAKATDNSGASAASSAVTVTVGATFSANINFQAPEVTPPVGYFSDVGEVYGLRESGLTYGWNISHTSGARDRRDNVDRRRATLCEIYSGGAWELEVPSGTYGVTVAIGDGTYPSTHTINVEGVNYWSRESLIAGEFRSRTENITVSDGKLSIDQGEAGDGETRIVYVIVTALNVTPSVPTMLTATAISSNAIQLNWADNSSTETGFQVRRSIHADFSASTLLAVVNADTPQFLDTAISAGTTYYYRVRAIGAAGSSALTASASATARMPDLDGDGIPDLLEGGAGFVGLDDRQIDSDGDGVSNAAEYLAETDAFDAGSHLAIARTFLSGAGASTTDFTIEFPTIAGPLYFVDYTDSLAGQIWTLVPGSERVGDGALQSATDTSFSRSRFYRLRVMK